MTDEKTGTAILLTCLFLKEPASPMVIAGALLITAEKIIMLAK